MMARHFTRFTGAVAFIAVFSFSNVCFAFNFEEGDTREQVATVETDAMDDSWHLDVIRSSDGAMKALAYESNRKKEPAKVLTLDQLKKGPQVLKEIDGHKVIYLSIESDFTPTRGGHANVRYLESGMSDSYRNFRILVDTQGSIVLRSDPNPKDSESDDNSYNSVFNHLFMKKRTFLGRVIGIGRIIPSMK